MAGIYNYPVTIQEDTVLGMTIVLKLIRNAVLKDLTNCTIIMEVFRSRSSKIYITKSSANANEILIQDIPNCIVQILDFKPTAAELPDGDYHYKIRGEWDDGTRHTFVGGEMPIRRYPEAINPHKI